MSQASTSQINEFVRVVDEFMRKYDRLQAARGDVYASGDARLIADYESAMTRGRALKATIETTLGVWQSAKAALRDLSQSTSMYIGDAVDWLREKFGFDGYGNGLGALQVPAALWITGIVASAFALIKVFDKLFVSIEASKLQRENPQLSREKAVEMAEGLLRRNLFGGLAMPLGILGLAAVVLLMMR